MTSLGSGRLAGKAALVTGASRGIGAAIARRFAAEGAGVVNASLIEPVYDDPAVASIIGDVSDSDGARQLVEEAVERLGKLDILVNNAGIELEATIEHTSPVCSRMRCFTRRQSLFGKGEPLRSRYASSRPTTSTRSTPSRTIAITCRDTFRYSSMSRGTRTISGQRRCAVASGSAECTPNLRAS